MICKSISFLNFRNIENARLELEPGVNLLYGQNAEGKTNALEGIYLFAQGRSHRTVHEKEFIRHGQDYAALRMVYQVANAVKIPVVGMGGVSSAEDVIEMMLAGATAVEVGAANLVNPYICRDIVNDLPAVMDKYRINTLSEIIGGAR